MGEGPVGSATSTEKTGRTRNGTKQRTMSGGETDNFKDIVKLPRIKLNPNSDIEEYKVDFGMTDVPDAEVAAMFGALNGSKFNIVKKTPSNSSIKAQYTVTIDNKFLDIPQERTVFLYDNGAKYTSNDFFFLKTEEGPDGKKVVIEPYRNQGIGTKSVARQAYYSQKHGLTFLKLYGLRNDKEGDIGHYAWAVNGFDRKLTQQESALASSRFNDPNIRTIGDILDKPGGKDYWREFGNSGEMFFDLRSGSRSWKRLTDYSQSKLSKKTNKIW